MFADNGKVFEATESKLTNLKRDGIVPFSVLALDCSVLCVFICMLWFGVLPLLGMPPRSGWFPHTHPSELSDYRGWVLWAATCLGFGAVLVSIFVAFAAAFAGLLQTGFRVWGLSNGRNPFSRVGGVDSRTGGLVFFRLMAFGLCVFVLCLTLYSRWEHLEDYTSLTLPQSTEFTYGVDCEKVSCVIGHEELYRAVGYTSRIIIAGHLWFKSIAVSALFFLIVLGVAAWLIERVRFRMSHRMTLAELEQELRESRAPFNVGSSY